MFKRKTGVNDTKTHFSQYTYPVSWTLKSANSSLYNMTADRVDLIQVGLYRFRETHLKTTP